MKLRLHRNSVRLRLTPVDVERLQNVGSTSETTCFSPTTEFTYRITLVPMLDKIRARLDSEGISIDLPASMVGDWANGESTSLRHLQPVAPGQTLEITVEKDFECLDSPAASGEVFYPNPNKAC